MLFDLANVKVLHLEPTTACNAACPQCSREILSLYNHANNYSEMSLQQFQKLVSIDFVRRLEKFFMCGTFGEPSIAKDAIKIFEWVKSVNPNITLGINTNGGVRTPQWWRNLAKTLTGAPNYAVFSIDGLEDTNHIYRKNVRWNKVIANATAFIKAGGSAHWDMLIFKHNEHQVDDAKQLAKNLGFTWFRAKVSSRFQIRPVEWLSPPTGYQTKNVTDSTIQCHALKEKSIYISANGKILPCCFFGNQAFTQDPQTLDILNSPNWIKISSSWEANPHKICKQSCSAQDGNTRFGHQFKIEEQL